MNKQSKQKIKKDFNIIILNELSITSHFAFITSSSSFDLDQLLTQSITTHFNNQHRRLSESRDYQHCYYFIWHCPHHHRIAGLEEA